ncbi:MAG: hypothetical protein ACMUJM_14210 [bacterium]
MLRKIYSISLVCFSFIALAYMLLAPVAEAQNWVSLPPYNILWPLFSPALSPPDPFTGAPTPLLTELSSNTVLPVQPVMGLNPNAYEWTMGIVPPWLFYNGPTGVVFFDVYYGMNAWPPPSFLDAAGAPVPITLPIAYSLLSIPLLKEARYLVELGNINYLLAYGGALGVNPASLLSFTDLFGLVDFPGAI